jgi:formate dehydrogenase subunit gamma
LNAAIFLELLATGACLYLPALSTLVGRRYLIDQIHVYTGLTLPLPLLVGALLARRGGGFRLDLSRLNRWTGDDGRWLAAALHHRELRARLRSRLEVGKFNAGQKLNAAIVGGSIFVMLGTGSLLNWYKRFPLGWRVGATFVHDWVAIGLGLLITGHILYALSEPEALRSIFTGRISRQWAKRHAPGWLNELEETDPDQSGPVPRNDL